MSKKRKTLTAVFGAAAIIWMTVIFGFSSNNAEESSKQSHGVVEMILGMLVPDFDEMDEADREALIDKYDKPVRKTAHFASYALLGFLLCACFGSYRWLPDKKIVPSTAAFLFCLLFAIGDEYHQTLVDGRAGRMTDVLIDSLGALTGTLLVFAAVALFEKKKRAH